LNNKFYSIAGINYCVSVEDDVQLMDDGILENYVSDATDDFHKITFCITEDIPGPEGELIFSDDGKFIYLTDDSCEIRYEGVTNSEVLTSYMRIARGTNESFVHIRPLSFGTKTILRAMEIEHFIVKNYGLLFHCAYVEVDGKALIFTAPSGIGKSTQAKLWCDNKDAALINGDRCALMLKDGILYACGVPYCGSSRVNINKTLPVWAIVYLEQAPVSTVNPLVGISSFKRIMEGVCVNTWNSSDMSLCINTVTAIAENIPVINLSCTPDVTAVEILSKALKEL